MLDRQQLLAALSPSETRGSLRPEAVNCSSRFNVLEQSLAIHCRASIKRAQNAETAPVEHMGANLRCRNIGVTQQLLEARQLLLEQLHRH